jgi:betaine reductase
MTDPAILETSYVLAHAPDFVRYGSKPTRELAADPSLLEPLTAALRPWDEVVAYPPNQVFIGNMTPEELAEIPRPWYEHLVPEAPAVGPFGRIIDQAALYGLMKLSDDFDLITISEALASEALESLEGMFDLRLDKVVGTPMAEIERIVDGGGSGMPLFHNGALAGFFRTVLEEDPSLHAHVLFENLATKATAVIAVYDMFQRGSIAPEDVDYLLNTGEEAVGDRYQRGGGSLSKAVGEVVECVNATGSDIKAFCSAPVHALIIAGALVAAGLHDRVVVLGGGSQAKMGMKFRGHLASEVPIMEDCLASMAFLVGADEGEGMRLRLDLTGRHPIGAGSSSQAIYQALVVDPLDRGGLKFTDIDRYAVELHNPEITEPGNSGDVPKTNYRTLAAMAVRSGEIDRTEMDDFVRDHGMPGFSPTQGHIPAGVPYLGHADAAMRAGRMKRCMIVAKGSLFLGRMTQLVDGVSFIVEPAQGSGKEETE